MPSDQTWKIKADVTVPAAWTSGDNERALDLQWDPILPRIGTPDTRPLRLYLEWGVYGVSNPQEAWDNRVKLAARLQQLRDLGYDVEGGQVPDGVGWASWRNRTDVALRAILPPRPAGP